MFSIDDLKISCTSIEFSLFYQQQIIFCPSCGFKIENNSNEVRLSSLLLFIGVGSYICYQYIIKNGKKNKKKDKQNKLTNSIISLRIKENYEQFFDNKNTNFNAKKKIILTSTPFIHNRHNNHNNHNRHHTSSSISSIESDIAPYITDLSDYPSTESNINNTPLSPIIGDGTVAKLDQLLMQVQDIKKSVFEIDAELFEVTESKQIFDSNLLRIVPTLTPSYSVHSDFNEHINMLTETQTHSLFNEHMNVFSESQTPSLEWDINDINSSLDMFVKLPLKNSKCEQNQTDLSSPSSVLDLSPTSSSEKSYQLNSHEESINTKTSKALKELIEEAQKLGILNDLIETLITNKNNKRDSAFCED